MQDLNANSFEEIIYDEGKPCLVIFSRKSCHVCQEVHPILDEIEEEYGDLLFAVVNLGRHLKVTPEIALTKASDKFVNRFKEMEEKAVSDGKDMAELSAKELDELWEFVKKA